MQRLDGDDVSIDAVTGVVGLPLMTARTRSGRLGFVGSYVARQSLDCVLRRLPLIYIALCEGGSTVIYGKRSRSTRGLSRFLDSRDLSSIRRSHPSQNHLLAQLIHI
jgi:hypothetical protein